MNEDRERLLRFLDGELPEAEAQAIRARLGVEPDFRAEIDRLQALRQVLAAGRADAFAPYFGERVLRRLALPEKARAAEGLYDALSWVFTRTAFAGLALAGALGTYNVLDYRALGLAASFLEAFFGLPSATLSDALTYGAL